MIVYFQWIVCIGLYVFQVFDFEYKAYAYSSFFANVSPILMLLELRLLSKAMPLLFFH